MSILALYCDVPAKLLGEAQIDYDIVPIDLLASCLEGAKDLFPRTLRPLFSANSIPESPSNGK